MEQISLRKNALVDSSYSGTEGQLVSGVRMYKSLQAALNDVPANNTNPYIIYMKAGGYREVITVDKPYITLVGEDAQRTKITYDNASGTPKPGGGTLGTTGSATVTVKAEDFTALNLTFENSFDEANSTYKDKQAVAIKTQADRAIFRNCRFLGNQDTLYANLGRQYFVDSYIEGDVDFIFGGATAVFENSEVRSLSRGSDKNNGYITAASTLISDKYGYLFLNSKLTSDEPMPGTVSLGRPWQPGNNPDAVASTVFKNTFMGDHINEQGWTDFGKSLAANARYYEFGSAGPGAVASPTRPVLTKAHADEQTPELYFGDWYPKAVLESLNQPIVTRAAFMDSINQLFSFQGKRETTFSDVTAGSKEADAVTKAVYAGYVDGFSDRTARPNAYVTREQAAVMLAKALGLKPQSNEAAGYKDEAYMAEWSKGYIREATKAGILTPLPDGSFSGTAPLTEKDARQLIEKAKAALASRNVNTSK